MTDQIGGIKERKYKIKLRLPAYSAGCMVTSVENEENNVCSYPFYVNAPPGSSIEKGPSGKDPDRNFST